MHVHPESLGDRMGLIDPTRPCAPDIDLLESHNVRLIGCDHIRNPSGRQLTIRTKAAMHVVGQNARHRAPFSSCLNLERLGSRRPLDAV
jgi:hypothetical protein